MARVSMNRATAELTKLDPVMRRMADRFGVCRISARRRFTHFEALARAIVYQQLAGRAAAAIHARFAALLDGEVTPDAVLARPIEALLGVGLSANKARSISDLAAKVMDGTVDLERIGRLDDEAIISQLVRVRGIGRWTAEMFLIFQLRRLDVWPVLDFGVRKGYQQAYRLDELPTPRELVGLGERFRPFRSVAAWYCWKAADGDAWE